MYYAAMNEVYCHSEFSLIFCPFHTFLREYFMNNVPFITYLSQMIRLELTITKYLM